MLSTMYLGLNKKIFDLFDDLFYDKINNVCASIKFDFYIRLFFFISNVGYRYMLL